ncbi:hypothetical protein MMC08_008707, partial [Hypocenomyce scalaris]|nr:hypothetical protein [Hypocenomyce scalaris]
MEFSKGPRRLIFSNLAEKENKKLKDAPGVALLPGNIRIHSSSTPGLLHGVEYTAKFTQSISYPDLSNNKNTVSVPPLVSSKTFVVEGNPYYLDSALVNSVYPPPGNSDYSNVLPHVLFNDLQAPWSLEMPASDGQPLPCLGLLVFTEDELTLTPAQTQSLNTALGVNPPTTPAPTRTPTLAYNLAVRDLVTLRTAESSGVSGPVAFSAETATDASPVQVIFLQGSRFAGLFSTYQNGSAQPVAGTYPADLSRYRYMSHVRYFNASGIANKDNEPEVKVSATVSPRTGPLEITKPTTVFAHLISLPGVHENMRTDPSKVAALISLYSWSYTCLPASSFAVGKCFEVLGNSIQPLRSPDSFTSIPRSPATTADDWARNRLLGGFNLIRYRTPTGEITPAIHRGLLTPIKYPAVEFPPSDYGTDLAIIDESTGFLDLTFQLAWVLGRTSAMADRTLSAALMRLRTNVHNETLANAKKQLDSTLGLGFVDMSTTLSKLPTTFSGLTVRSTPATFTFIAQRWQKAALGTSTRSLLSFSNDSVQDSYKTILKPGISTFAAAVSSLQAAQATSPSLHTNPIEIYNEVNSPLSSDYATLLAWLMDRWFLQGLPMINLIPDPSFVPQESIRTFFVDQSWFRVFADGALSLSDHFNEDDDVRESIKASLDTYLGSNLKDINYPPQIPKWGFFLRSEVVLKFPDLRISAPRQDPNDPRAEVLRMEAIDQDLLIVLFDREPDTGAFPQGISIQPPEHQLSSMFGSIEGVVNNQLTQNWTKVYHDLTLPGKIPDPYGHPPLSTTFDLTDPVRNNGVFDCLNRSLCPYWFASIAQSTQKWAGNPPQNMISNSPALIA